MLTKLGLVILNFASSEKISERWFLSNFMPENFKTYFYWAYGIKIESVIRLSDLVTAESSIADVRIRYGKIVDSLLEIPFENAQLFERPGCRVQTTAKTMLVEWERVGKVLIHGGNEVIVEPESNVLEEDLQPFLTGPVLSVLLHQLNFFVLHASAVIINDSAIVFLGAKGYGKSTLAAHLQVRGHQLISDDIIPVKFENDRVLTVPGYPRIKLFEDSITAVGENPANLPLIHRFVEKRSFQCAKNFSTKPIFLQGVYVLAENEEIFLEKLNPTDAFIEVTKHTYLNRFLEALNYQSEHFRQCQKLVQTIPVLKLNRPHNFVVMNEVCTLLENHVQELNNESEIYRLA